MHDLLYWTVLQFNANGTVKQVCPALPPPPLPPRATCTCAPPHAGGRTAECQSARRRWRVAARGRGRLTAAVPPLARPLQVPYQTEITFEM